MALWTPALIDTALWLDAADESTITLDGDDKVEQWDDKSGNDWHAPAPTESARPEIIEDELNGHSVLRFDGTGHYLRHETAELLENSAQEFTAFIVLKTDVTISRFAFVYGDDSRRQIAFQRFDGDELFYAGTTNNQFGEISRTDAWGIRAWVYDGSQTGNSDRLKIYRNGENPATSYTETILANLGTLQHGFFVGARGNLATFLAMDLAELIVFPSALNQEHRQSIEGYLAHKWGLEDELPTEHPYKDAAPEIFSISGIITDKDGNPCQRKVYAVTRPTDSTAPAILAHTLSDDTTGEYELILPTDDEVTRIVVSEDDNDPLLNDLIDRVIPE